MITDTGAPLANLLGFITGIVLYGMLLWMVFTSRRELNRLLLLTGFLGFAWNAGALAGYGLMNLGIADSSPLLLAAAFGALCFLPSVVVHSALAVSDKLSRRMNLLIAIPAYAMSSVATVMHFNSAMTSGTAPSQIALRGVTVGFAGLILVLLVATRGQENRGSILWVVAMSVFAVSALHLSYHQGNDPWWLQLVGSRVPSACVAHPLSGFSFCSRRHILETGSSFHSSCRADFWGVYVWCQPTTSIETVRRAVDGIALGDVGGDCAHVPSSTPQRCVVCR